LIFYHQILIDRLVVPARNLNAGQKNELPPVPWRSKLSWSRNPFWQKIYFELFKGGYHE